MQIKGILFDLDDTLYNESDFVKSGFAAVAKELEFRGVGKSAKIQKLLESFHFNESRNFVFNKAADELNFPITWINELVDIYRLHHPAIEFFSDTKQVIQQLKKNYLLGCITDGWAQVQRNKINALNLKKYIDCIVICDDFGREYWKPNPFAFYKCCEILGLETTEVVFVGDNPERDIQAAKNAEIKSVHIKKTEGYFFYKEDNKTQADFEISSIQELMKIIDSINEC